MSEQTQNNAFSGRRLLPLGVLVIAGLAFVAFGGRHYLTAAVLAEHREWLTGLVTQGGVGASLVFIAVYAGLVALSVPGAWIFTVASGFLFGPWLGTGYALVGATLGATAIFLAARTGLAGLLARAGPRLRRLEAGFHDNALSYLLVLRLIPVFPFWLVNLAAGATGMRTATYVAATFLGMIPATFVFASLGSGIGEAVSGGEPGASLLFRPGVLLPIVGLAALALLPVFYKRWRGRGQTARTP